MKKFLVTVLSLLMVLSLAACSGGKEVDGDARLKAIKSAGKLTVCMEPYFAPFEFIDPSKEGQEKFVGVDVEFAKKIAEKIGVELEIVPLEFGAVLSGAAEGKYDLAISALAWSPSREEAMKMSKGYYTSDKTGEYGLLVRTEDAEKYTSLESLADARIITQSGSVQSYYFDEFVKQYKSISYTSSMPDSYLSVKEGKADVCICSIAAADLWAEANGGVTKTTVYRFPFDKSKGGTRVGTALKGTDTLIELVNQVIDELTAEGKFFAWNEQYKQVSKDLGIE